MLIPLPLHIIFSAKSQKTNNYGPTKDKILEHEFVFKVMFNFSKKIEKDL